MRHKDICIVGGGLVGLSAALALSRLGYSINLIEARSLGALQDGTIPAALDARSLALSHATVKIFTALGLWEPIESLAAPIKEIHVSSSGRFGVTRLLADELNLEAMGYVVEYHLLFEQLLSALKLQKNVELLSPANVEDLDCQPQGVALNIMAEGEPQKLMADLLIVAEGASAAIRERLGVTISTTDYHQVALAANVETEAPFSGIAFERFTPEGPMAMLPLTESRYALVWTQHPERAQQLLKCSDRDFLQELQKRFGYRLGVLRAVGQRASFELKLSRAQPLVTMNAVLIGNAANTLHPVAGQGFNLAMRDIAVLYDQLKGLNLRSEQLGIHLEKYQQLRMTDQQQTVQAGHGLVKLFSNNWPLLNHARAAALTALDLMPPLKQEVSWRGMGFGQGLSTLMRGHL